jgi:hypothetical protein
VLRFGEPRDVVLEYGTNMRIGFASGDIARAVDLLWYLFVSPLQDTGHRL